MRQIGTVPTRKLDAVRHDPGRVREYVTRAPVGRVVCVATLGTWLRYVRYRVRLVYLSEAGP